MYELFVGTLAGHGDRQPSALEIEMAESQGAQFAKFIKRLKSDNGKPADEAPKQQKDDKQAARAEPKRETKKEELVKQKPDSIPTAAASKPSPAKKASICVLL